MSTCIGDARGTDTLIFLCRYGLSLQYFCKGLGLVQVLKVGVLVATAGHACSVFFLSWFHAMLELQ